MRSHRCCTVAKMLIQCDHKLPGKLLQAYFTSPCECVKETVLYDDDSAICFYR